MGRLPNKVKELEKEVEQNNKDMASMDRDLQLYQIEVSQLEKDIRQLREDKRQLKSDLKSASKIASDFKKKEDGYKIDVEYANAKVVARNNTISDKDRKIQELMKRADDYKAQVIVYKHIVSNLLDKILEKI